MKGGVITIEKFTTRKGVEERKFTLNGKSKIIRKGSTGAEQEDKRNKKTNRRLK